MSSRCYGAERCRAVQRSADTRASAAPRQSAAPPSARRACTPIEVANWHQLRLGDAQRTLLSARVAGER
eukprot:scaffold18864_cov68-Phaeocystis_antarctica.AAC.3